MKNITFLILLLVCFKASAQIKVNTADFNPKNEFSFTQQGNIVNVKWPAGGGNIGQVALDMTAGKPLFKTIAVGGKGAVKTVSTDLDPAFLLSIGKRDLQSQNGWNIFFDKVPLKPYKTFAVVLEKSSVAIKTTGSQTIISIGSVKADHFSGDLEITFYNGSPMFNIAAVVSTQQDATAIVYDAGLIDKNAGWKNIAWVDTKNNSVKESVNATDTAKNIAVKYRAIAAKGQEGAIAIFPAPHQYFYPLDEAFNLKFTWYGNQYRQMLDGYGMGIRQELKGDNRFVPWFNAPPDTKQRLNFFCYASPLDENAALTAVKKFTHNDRYVKLPGFKTMSSHFHNEFVMRVLMGSKEIPKEPDFVRVFKNTGIDIVHLAEFHYTANPKGPDEKRLPELKMLHDMCRSYSDENFLLLPGEEPNEFFGGHWLSIFPREVYWVLSRKDGVPFVEDSPVYGKVYHIGDKQDMLKLLEQENGLAWTAHPRTKGSVKNPDAYKDETFFKSDRFMGAAWKAMPADLSQPRLGKRVLDLLDDMNNWGDKKTIIAEADLFTITPENEMYAHLNVNYMMMDALPKYKDGWQPVVTAMQKGKFFSSTGEVLMPQLTVNGKTSGETIALDAAGNAAIKLKLNWTFPMNFIEVISGDGSKVYRDKIDITDTKAFGDKLFQFKTKLTGRKWLRVEAWDIAANGAFSQTFYIGN